MANPAPTINQINAFNATQGTTIDFNIIGGTELVRSNRIYIYDLSDNSLICTHLYVSTESIHELPANTDGSIVYESGKSSADFVNGKQYYAQIQTFTDIAGTQGGSGLSVSKLFWCLVDPSLTIATIPSSISTTSYNVSATYNANTSVVSNIIQQYQFNLYSATGSLLQSSGVVVGNGEQQGTSTAYDISYNFSGLSVGSSYYVAVDVTTTQGMSVNAQSSTFTVSIDTPTLGEATVVNNACDGYISVTSNLSSEYGGSASGEIATFETDSVNRVTKLEVALTPTQLGSGTPSPSNVRPIVGHSEVEAKIVGKNLIALNLSPAAAQINNLATIVTQTKDLLKFTTSSGTYANVRLTYTLPTGTYTLSTKATSSDSYIPVISVYNGNTLLANAVNQNTPKSFTLSEETTINIRFFGSENSSAVRTVTFYDVQLEQGSTATDYVPYVEPVEVSQDFNVTLTPTVIDETPYLFKKTGDVRGDRESLELVGGTVNWNQLVQNGDFSTESNWSASNATKSISSGICTFTATSRNGNVCTSNPSRIFPSTPNNHKYFALAEVKLTTGTTDVVLRLNGGYKEVKTASNTNWQTLATVYNLANSDNGYVQVMDKRTSGWDAVQVKTIMLIDLTQLFGSTIADYIYSLEQANAGDGVAFFRKLFPKPYYPYDAGTIKSVEGVSAHKTVGFNAWDEELEEGDIATATGLPVTADYGFRTKNFIPILPNTQYYNKCPSRTEYARLWYYDADKNFISYNGGRANDLNAVITTPQNAYYMKFTLRYASYGTTYKNDICINLSWDGERNGEYEPYVEHSYPLDDSLTLRGIPKIANGKLYYDGDTYESDGTVTRKYGIVDLGSLNYSLWNSNENRDVFAFSNAQLNDLKSATTDAEIIEAICSKFIATSYNATWKVGEMSYVSAPTRRIAFVVPHGQYADASAFKSAMSGVYLLYPLATPTTEQAQPFESIQKVTPNYGTEEFVTTTNVPVGNNTQYYTRDIYGGTLDLVSGVLTVDRKGILLDGSEDWYWESNNSRAWVACNDMKRLSDYRNTLLCDKVRTSQHNGYLSSTGITGYQASSAYQNENWLYIKVDEISALDGLKSWMASNNLQVIYPLATPLTYQLTPHEVETLIGTNNVWSNAGDVSIEFHIPITDLLVKRQDVDDVSGNWLTLYSQPVEQASDMDFTFIDFLNQYGKTYKYALVPLLTQTQSGVEVEVEGGYTVSDAVQSVFDGVFIVDSTGSQKCKANVGYGNVDMNQTVGTITPIGAKYPVVITNSKNQYHNGSISGTIVPDDYYFNGNLSRIDMVNKRDELEQFLTNKRAKIIKDWNGKIWLVMIMDNVSCTFNNNYGMGIVNFSTNWVEVGDPTNQQDLQATGLINVGGV